ncbi:unnamed protein product [Lactuca saligna]|uniref:Uncharacterized protein n=1 Tax=Lactuca saligna TaxID=75948 RepID=A0AA35VM91_LACSI|nr:unnamed protein product [Lactuca saligna]
MYAKGRKETEFVKDIYRRLHKMITDLPQLFGMGDSIEFITSCSIQVYDVPVYTSKIENVLAYKKVFLTKCGLELFPEGSPTYLATHMSKDQYKVKLLPSAATPSPSTTGFRQSNLIAAPHSWSGGSLCSTASTGRFSYAAHECGSRRSIECGGGAAAPPSTIAEFILNEATSTKLILSAYATTRNTNSTHLYVLQISKFW